MELKNKNKIARSTLVFLAVAVVFVSIVSGTLSINTFGPGDVSSFTVTSDDSSYYIEIDEDTYTSDFTVTTAEVNVSMDEVLLPIISFGGDDLGDINDFSLVESWDTDPPGVGANDVSGIAYDEEGYIWMVDYIDEEMYQFYKNGTYLDNWDIHTSGADDTHGITNYGEYLYVVDEVDDEVYVFNKTSENLLDNWDISGQTGSPRGITTDGTYIWIVEGNPRIYKYYTNGTYIDYLQLAGYSPQGITIYEDNIFILDDTDNEIVILDLDGNLKGAIDVEPHNTMSGVTTDGEYIWGVFPADDVVNKYNFYTTSDEQLDFSTELTTSMNSCTGDPCKLYFNITGEDWGNVTLDGLDIEINTRPTTPTTLSPDNNSVWFNDPTLTCSGSTDLDGDDINYSFIAEGNASLQNSSSTTYEWEDLEVGSYNWRCQACDNSSCSDFTENRTLYKMGFEECDSGNVSLNFTFKDEESLDNINSTIDLSLDFDSDDEYEYFFTNTTVNDDYTFCLSPAGVESTASGNIIYSNPGYEPRTYYFDGELTGDTQYNQTLYLLDSGSGIYSSIQVQTTGASPIPGVTLTVARKLPGEGDYTAISQKQTDSSGLSTFWVNPNYEHKYTASKTGYTTQVFYLTPSQDTYTIQMVPATEEEKYSSPTKGLIWNVGPTPGYISAGEHLFEFNITSSYDNLLGCKFEIVDENQTVLSSAEGCGTGLLGGDNLSDSYTIPDSVRKLWGWYYVKLDIECNIAEGNGLGYCDGGIYNGDSCTVDSNCTGWGYIDADTFWSVWDVTENDANTLGNFFAMLTTLGDFGEGNEQDYSRVVSFFLVMTLLLGLLNYSTGVELRHPGSVLILIIPIVWIASIAGFLTYDLINSSVWWEQYLIATTATFFSVGYILNYIRRDNSG